MASTTRYVTVIVWIVALVCLIGGLSSPSAHAQTPSNTAAPPSPAPTAKPEPKADKAVPALDAEEQLVWSRLDEALSPILAAILAATSLLLATVLACSSVIVRVKLDDGNERLWGMERAARHAFLAAAVFGSVMFTAATLDQAVVLDGVRSFLSLLDLGVWLLGGVTGVLLLIYVGLVLYRCVESPARPPRGQ